MSGTVLKVGGLLVVAAGWAAVLRGLFLLPVSPDPRLDLEAGPAFAINVAVYLPAVVLTVLLVVAVPVAAATSRGSEIGLAASALVAAFIWWAMVQEPLLLYVPGLRSTLLIAAGLVVVGMVVLAVALATRRAPVATPATAHGEA